MQISRFSFAVSHVNLFSFFRSSRVLISDFRCSCSSIFILRFSCVLIRCSCSFIFGALLSSCVTIFAKSGGCGAIKRMPSRRPAVRAY